MKILMFLGQSQYDVLRSCAREAAAALRAMGHEAVLFDLCVLGAGAYQQLLADWRPDLTVGFNPVFVPLDTRGTPHHAVTRTPHVVCLADHPYAHLYNRALVDPNAPTVSTLVVNYESALVRLGIERWSRARAWGAAPELADVFPASAPRPIPVLLAGSWTEPGEYLTLMRERFPPNVAAQLLAFCEHWLGLVQSRQRFLPTAMDAELESFLGITETEPAKRVPFMRTAFPLVDLWYRNFVRGLVVEHLVKAKVPLHVLGSKSWSPLLERAQAVTLLPPMPYEDYRALGGAAKVVINIFPVSRRFHDRVPAALMAGASLCSTAMSELTDRLPALSEASTWFEWDDIPSVGERIHAALADDAGRVARAAEGQRVARAHLSWHALAEDLLDAAARHHGAGTEVSRAA